MPQNFPEVWKKRVEINLTQQDKAKWLEGIAEIDAEVLEVNANDISEKNIIYLPTTEFEPDVLIDNSTYPLEAQAYEDGTVQITLKKYQTKVMTLSDDQVIGASYSKIDAVTASGTRAINKKKYAMAIHSIAPAGDTANTPIFVTTGRTGKFDGNGNEIIWKDGDRLMCTYIDLVDHKAQYDELEVDEEGRRLVLTSQHWNDLLKDRERFGDNFANYREGTLAPVIAGFEIYQYIKNPIYTTATKVKKAFGSTADAGDYKASVSFYVPNIAKKTGLTKQYFKKAADDPDNQTNRLAYRHYYVVIPKRAKYIGAILSGVVE